MRHIEYQALLKILNGDYFDWDRRNNRNEHIYLMKTCNIREQKKTTNLRQRTGPSPDDV